MEEKVRRERRKGGTIHGIAGLLGVGISMVQRVIAQKTIWGIISQPERRSQPAAWLGLGYGETRYMQSLLNAVRANASRSKALGLLQAKLSTRTYIRFSWFEEWASQSQENRAGGFFASLFLFFFSHSEWLVRRTIALAIDSGEELRERINSQIIDATIKENSPYFDQVEANPLTLKQREACASDEDSTLVVAGAGTGKTSTILAKIGLLIATGQCVPNQILAISYTNKSAEELAVRVRERLKADVRVSTFHRLGLEILTEALGFKPTLASHASDSIAKTKLIDGIVLELQKLNSFCNDFIEFNAYFPIESRQAWDFETLADYVNWMRSCDIRSLDGVRKKSFEECIIANWLILNGVPFEYEKKYEYSTETKQHRQYQPDFWLPDANIYLEHFGVDENGNCAPFIDSIEYRKGMEFKRALHSTHGTTLVETYSWEHRQGQLLTALKEKLLRHKCSFNPMSAEDALRKMNEAGTITNFAELLSSFVTLYKGNGKQISQIASSAFRQGREALFLRLFGPIFNAYESYNKKAGVIDFEDMIVQATAAAERTSFEWPYKYILIDEFQDISPGRAALVNALRSRGKDCALFAVGDDWQSIYRFAGSDIGSMTKFSKIFGHRRQVMLDMTFRFDDKAAQVSGKFIQKSPAQIRKNLESVRKSDTPSIVIFRQCPGETPFDWPLREIERQSVANNSVLFLERYKFHLPDHEQWKRLKESYPKLSLSKESIHAAKGLEADFVIMGLRGGPWGFPSQVVDDPILELVLQQADEFPHGEERRLMYVAITRAKKKTYIVCDIEPNASEFATELISGKEYFVAVEGVNAVNRACRKCKSGKMLLRDGSYGTFFGCSNHPLCKNTEPACSNCEKGFLASGEDTNISCDVCGDLAKKCPKCGAGILQKKMGRFGSFVGCSNYKDPDINCSYKQSTL